MKKISIILIIFSILFIYFYFNIKKEKTIDNNTLAIVNNDKITIKEFKKKLNEIKLNYISKEKLKAKKIRENILNRLIIEKLIIQEAKNKNIQVSKQNLDRYIKNIKQNYSKKEFKKILFNKFKTEEEWTNEIKKKILIEKTLSNIVTKKINIDEKELLKYYNNYYKDKKKPKTIILAQIFTPSKEKIKLAKKEIEEGNNFENIVKKYSKGPEATKDGLVGEIQKGEGPEVFDFAFNLEEGKTSEVLESNHGYHILKVLKINESKNYSFQEAKKHILNEIIYNKEKLIYESWLKRKIKNSKIIKNKKALEYIG
jgi:foldase protein PrsA